MGETFEKALFGGGDDFLLFLGDGFDDGVRLFHGKTGEREADHNVFLIEKPRRTAGVILEDVVERGNAVGEALAGEEFGELRLKAGADGGDEGGEVFEAARLILHEFLGGGSAAALVDAAGVALGEYIPCGAVVLREGENFLGGIRRKTGALHDGLIDVHECHGEHVILDITERFSGIAVDDGAEDGLVLGLAAYADDADL